MPQEPNDEAARQDGNDGANTEELPQRTEQEGSSTNATSALLGERLVSSDLLRHTSSGIPACLSDITEKSESMVPSSSDDTSPSVNEGRPPLAPPPAATLPRPPPISETSRIQSAPHVPILPRPPPVADHTRMQSTGEYSFMSALTDSSGDGAPRDPPKQSRNRTVSWDQNYFDNAATRIHSRSPPQQPVLHEEHGEDDKSLRTGNRKRTRTLDLADLKADNPMETEAETAIIAAIEEESRIEENRRRADSASVLMPHVPDEGLDIFEEASTKLSLQQTSSSHSQEAPKSPLSPNGSTGGRHRRNKSTMPPEGLKLESTNNTLEHTLSGLATAMRKIHTETSEQVDESEVKRSHRRLPSRDIGRPGALLEDFPINHADTLVHNANKLLRRNVHKADSSDESSSGGSDVEPVADQVQEKPKPKPIWNIFDAKPDPKKTDGAPLEQVDEISSDQSSKVESSAVKVNGDESSESSANEDIPMGDIEEGIVDDGPSPNEPTTGLGGAPNSRTKKRPLKKARRRLRHSRKRCKLDLEMFAEFLQPKKAAIVWFIRGALLVLLPLAGVAAVLFYLTGNPLMTKNGASISWLLLFIARQIVTFTMSEATSLLFIDFLSLRTRWTVRVFGPTMALFIVQSKGFPFIMTCWSIYDFVLLSGAHALANHWLFWQELIAMCNGSNPSGDIPSSSTNYRILGSFLGAGIAVSIKRFWVGLYLGRRTFAHYGDQLAKVIENMILISEVASLGRDFERGTQSSQLKLEKSLSKWDFDDLRSVSENSNGGEKKACSRPQLLSKTDRNVSNAAGEERVIDMEKRNKFTGTLTPSQRIKIEQLLDHWEEPETIQTRETGASINAILQFRQALAFMDNSFPFSLAFGPAENREACIESAQKVYERLMIRNPSRDRLPFDTIAVVAMNKNGDINQKKMKELIRIFRPNREGELSMLDFVRSCDTVYKSLRLLRASISNSGQIDQAFEVLINYAFYIVLVCIILAANGFNPLALFLSFSSIILAFAFVIGSASSKYFEGILFILVRRPYDIGDRIAIADVNSETCINGTLTWFVQKVDLFTTTVRYSGTNEVATLANGSLASSRIINGARSPKAVVHVYLKFGVDIPYSRVQVFKKTVESFIKSRPREWIALARFRATRLEADLGFIEYALDLQHRESWQNLAAILMSKADLASFCLEVSKQLNMRYQAPPLPVDLSLKDRGRLEVIKENVVKETTGTAEVDGSQPDDMKGSNTIHSSASPDVRAISALFERPQE